MPGLEVVSLSDRDVMVTEDEEQNELLPRPSVYEEAMAMLTGALMIYVFADLRDMVRRDEVQGLQLEHLEPPLTAEQVLQRIQGCEEALTKRAIDHEELKGRLEALKSIQAHGGSFYNRLFSAVGQQMTGGQTMVTHFVDTKAEEEIVHAIVVNETQQRISVVFRGSVTPKDFVQDAKCSQTKVDNPVRPLLDEEQQDTRLELVGIHTGFYEYLFHPTGSSNGEDGVETTTKTTRTRLSAILDDVKDALRSHPNYRLYIAGHSLGGALCTLLGFYAAVDDDLHELLNGQPVIVYSIASPYVGNWKFRLAFQHLERLRRLQHLRIANFEDLVTLMPFAVPKVTALSPLASMVAGAGNLYKHCGVRLQLISAERSRVLKQEQERQLAKKTSSGVSSWNLFGGGSVKRTPSTEEENGDDAATDNDDQAVDEKRPSSWGGGGSSWSLFGKRKPDATTTTDDDANGEVAAADELPKEDVPPESPGKSKQRKSWNLFRKRSSPPDSNEPEAANEKDAGDAVALEPESEAAIAQVDDNNSDGKVDTIGTTNEEKKDESDAKEEEGDPTFTIYYPKDHDANDEEYSKELEDSMAAGKSLAQAMYYIVMNDVDKILLYHSCKEYEKRLEKCQEALKAITLDDVYADTAIVGKLLDRDYKPKQAPSSMERASRAIQFLGGWKKPTAPALNEAEEDEQVEDLTEG